MLNTYGAVIWADSAEYFQSNNITGVLQQAREVGLVAWTIEDPTSAITHPKMFEFFKTTQDLYYFHRAIESSHMIVYSTPRVKEKVSLPCTVEYFEINLPCTVEYFEISLPCTVEYF